MYIVSKEQRVILNFDRVIELFTGTDSTAVVAKQSDGRMIMLQEYDTKREAETAIAMIAFEMERKTLVYVPSADEVRRQIDLNESRKQYSMTGKKPTRHGGS